MDNNGNNNVDGNGAKGAADQKTQIGRASIENAFSQHEFPSAMKLLVDQGKEIRDVLMRTSFVSRAERIAWMHIIAQCEEFQDSVSMQEAYDNISSMVSERGMARNQLVDAIIGDRRIKNSGGVGDWIRKKSGIGEPKEGAQQ